MLNKLINKEKIGLRKKSGDDKLVISLVLIAVGVALCFVYREQIVEVVKSAMLSLETKIDELFVPAP